MRRSNKREKTKRNKGFPYKSRPYSTVRTHKDYALVDSKGKIIKKFRLKATALIEKSHFENQCYEKLTIVFLPNEDIEDGRVEL